MRLYSREFEHAAAELDPKVAVLGRVCVCLLDEDAVMLPDEFLLVVPHQRAEVLVGGEDAALRVKLDDGE